MTPSISSAENSFSFSWSSNLNIFLSIIQWKTGWSKDIFLKKCYVWATCSFIYIQSNRKSIDCWVDNVEVIHCKQAWNSGWRSSFDDSWVIHFFTYMLWNKSDRKEYGFVLVLYRFQDISSVKPWKGDTAKLSRTGFIYKQKR